MKWLLSALAVFLSPAAAAAGSFYAGASVGESKAAFGSDFTSPTVTQVSQHPTATALKIFGGYEISSYLAIEGGYTRLGDPHLTTRNAGTGTELQRKFQAQSWNIAGKATLPLAGGVSAFGKLGLTRNSVKTYFFPAGMPEITNNRKDTLYGAGLAYAVGKNVSLRLEYESYGSFGNDPASSANATGRMKFSLWSVGLAYHLR